MKTKTHFAFRIDVWDNAGNSIVEHVAGVLRSSPGLRSRRFAPNSHTHTHTRAFGRPHVKRVRGGIAHDRVLRCTKDERARWSAVVPPALEKHLFLNVRRKYLLVPLLGKKS